MGAIGRFIVYSLMLLVALLVLVGCELCFVGLTENKIAILLLYGLEWGFVLAAFRVLCPWLETSRRLGYTTLMMILSVLSGWCLSYEHLGMFGTPYTDADESWYISGAAVIAEALRSSGWDFALAWWAGQDYGIDTGWMTWPYLVGLLSSVVKAEDDVSIHAIALGLNSFFLALLLIFYFSYFGSQGKRESRALFYSFLAVVAEAIFFSGMALKDVLTTLICVIMFVSCSRVLYDRIRLPWLILLGASVVLALGLRSYYIMVPMIVLYIFIGEKLHLGKLTLIALGGVCLLASYELWRHTDLSGVFFREVTVQDLVYMRTPDFAYESGLGAKLYGIPVLGPVVFYIASPLPFNPFSGKSLTFESVIRSVGSLLYVLGVGCVFIAIWQIKTRDLSMRFLQIFAVYVMLFAMVVITSNDPRYKLPTNPFLGMMLFLLWKHKYQKRKAPEAGHDSSGLFSSGIRGDFGSTT